MQVPCQVLSTQISSRNRVTKAESPGMHWSYGSHIEMLALAHSIAIHRQKALSQLSRGLLKGEAGLTFLQVSHGGKNACAVDMGRCKCG